MFLELPHDRGLLYCVSIAKFEGIDYELEVLAHVANVQAFPNGGHVFDQLRLLMSGGLHFGGRTLQFMLLECHDLCIGD